MLKGTRILMGEEAALYTNVIDTLRVTCKARGFKEVVIPSIWDAETFCKKISNETKDQMWSFADKGGRGVTLIPEVTGIIQEMYDSDWSKAMPKPIKLFYVNRCYRYERPQAGRYREFTQFGVEILGNKNPEEDAYEAKFLLKDCLYALGMDPVLDFDFKETVTRGLGYYIEDGFEVECESLGAQKQVAGGGRYAQGIGWAIGVDRLMLALDKKDG
jgi:histidyl-tRNA synthetase